MLRKKKRKKKDEESISKIFKKYSVNSTLNDTVYPI